MYNHAPENYVCPLCLAVQGIENEETMMKQEDIVYRDSLILVAINSKFVGNNPGHVIIFPVDHIENIYDLPQVQANRIALLAHEVAIALKTVRNCDGVMLHQNNEPASGQHAFHYHLHVFPRFENDHIQEQMQKARVSTPEERKPYSAALKKYFEANPIKST